MADTTIVQEVAEIRRRVERIEWALLLVIALVKSMILDRAKPHVNLSKPDFRRVSEKATKSILLGNSQNHYQ
jgi:hypothetical protein